jgi:glutamine synthetase
MQKRYDAVCKVSDRRTATAEPQGNKVLEYFADDVFDNAKMAEYLSQTTYTKLAATVRGMKPLDPDIADEVAAAMKEWAVSRGATHYTHWFQPLTGGTAEKHDAFLNLSGGRAIFEFRGKNLSIGEPDASSFPSGGLRSTFEARGYTAWDPTSPAFIKRHANGATLCIPTVFCSYTGEVLDKKTPLLRSTQVLKKAIVRLMKAFGQPEEDVTVTLGPEQEYFLIDKSDYEQRRDLVFTGRTLFGARAPKGQEMDDHYYGAIKPRVAEFMRDLGKELWKLGVTAKTRHNEVAPCQHELAPIYATTNIAVDHNQITMDMLKRVAERHGFACLLHEKPFAGVNGSGKHNNWSISTDSGENLLDPGKNPKGNLQFLLFLTAVIKAVDEYQDLMRVSVASAGNDHRLGANEAPPAIVSMFLGEDLTEILESIAAGKAAKGTKKTSMELGVHVLPSFSKDTTDRNRTSPFAFTGNKFEFRMPGSAGSLASANIMLNAAVAESLRIYADYLEKADDLNEALHGLIKHTVTEHGRILFSGNGYDESWVKEATENRGLSNYPTTADCLPHLLDEKNVAMLSRHGICSERELRSRCEILLDNYSKTEIIEANTMIRTVTRQILPAIEEFVDRISRAASHKLVVVKDLDCSYEKDVISKLSALADRIYITSAELEAAVEDETAEETTAGKAATVRDKVLPKMKELRECCDRAEVLVGKEYWPFPTYEGLLYSVE